MKKRNNKIKYNKFKYLLSNQKGLALVTVLIFTFLMLTFVVALMAMTGNDIKLSSMQRDSTKALYQADGGIEKAIWYLNSSEANTAGLNFHGELPGGTATEFYNVKISEIDPGPPEIKTLTSTGTIEGGGKYIQDRVVEVKLIKGITPVPGLTYDKAIFTDDDMQFNGGISISGNIHSNGDLYISSTIFIPMEIYILAVLEFLTWTEKLPHLVEPMIIQGVMVMYLRKNFLILIGLIFKIWPKEKLMGVFTMM